MAKEPTDKYSDFLTIGQAARMLGVAAETLRNWDKAGKLKPYRLSISSYRLYKLQDLEKLLKDIKK